MATKNPFEIEHTAEEINAMTDREFKNFMDNRFSEFEKMHVENIKKLNRISEQIIHGFLTDNKIKGHIIYRNKDALWVLFSLVLLSIYFVLFMALKVDIPKWTAWIFAISLFVIIWVAEYPVIWFLKTTRTSWVEKNYVKCQLFKGDYVKTYIRSSGRYETSKNYFVKFLDENNKKRKCKISYLEFEEYERVQPEYIWIIKYPKYKRGNFYIAYHPNSFQNNSSIKEISKYNVK